ncbi:MAG: hypothetical protein ACREJ6_09700, partial [Candidatus Methylomirabilis sp.]
VSGKGIHLPNPSYWPLVVAIGITMTLAGFLVGFPLGIPWINVAGAVILFVGVYGWVLEPAG